MATRPNPPLPASPAPIPGMSPREQRQFDRAIADAGGPSPHAASARPDDEREAEDNARRMREIDAMAAAEAARYPMTMDDGTEVRSERERDVWARGRTAGIGAAFDKSGVDEEVADIRAAVVKARRSVEGWRHGGVWTGPTRREFLELLSAGARINDACAMLDVSRQSAYKLRAREPGFALAWAAASLNARQAIADTLTERALEGVEEMITRSDGSVVIRRRFDQRLATRMLARLDRMADDPAPGLDTAAVRGVASDWEATLDRIGAMRTREVVIDDEPDAAEASAPVSSPSPPAARASDRSIPPAVLMTSAVSTDDKTLHERQPCQPDAAADAPKAAVRDGIWRREAGRGAVAGLTAVA